MKRILALHKLVVYILVCKLFAFSSCSDPTLIGADLLDDIKVDIQFTDTVSMNSLTIPGDSIPTFSPYNPFSFNSPFAGQLGSYLFGNFEDPLFGVASSSIYLQPLLRTVNTDFSGATLDSILLILPYDSSGIYGYGDEEININEEFGIEVLRVIEDIPNDQTLFSNANFATDPTAIANETFIPDLSPRPFVSASGDTVSIPHLAVSLSNEFGNEILSQDSTTFASDPDLLEFFKGIRINPTINTSGVLSFALRPDNSVYSGIYLYYTQDDEQKIFHLRSGNSSVRNVTLENNVSGAFVESFLDNSTSGRDTNFIQGMGGLQTKIIFPYIRDLNNVLVNKAELILSVAELDNDDITQFPPIEQLILFQVNTDQTISPIEDLTIVTQTQRQIEESFGGNLSPSDNVYKVNITAAFQQMIDGGLESELLISSISSAERANRSIIYGANHPSFPMVLNLTFTRK